MTRKEYYRLYMNKRYEKRRIFALDYLGNKCANCGAKEDLEFDHINRETKEFIIANGLLKNKTELIKELDKCQLLCTPCHRAKTLIDLNMRDAKNLHGTISSYRYCKCEKCSEANANYTREYRKKNGR